VLAPGAAGTRGPSSRTWRRASGDLLAGWQQRELWGHLGWQDIRQRYRRSVLGPLWITISMAVTAIALGLLYSQLFGQKVEFFLPYVTVGFIIWGFIQGCINEGTEVFIVNEGLIKHLPSPLSVHTFRMVWRQTLFFLHNLVVYVAMVFVYHVPLNWSSLLAIPAFVVLVLNGAWVALLVGIVSTRFRDIPPVTQSVVTLMFFMTPIVWVFDQLQSDPRAASRARYVELNPFLHFVEIIRRPMLGQSMEGHWINWIVAGSITVVGWALALLFMRNYRARVSYWV
jgi:ABC-2 type transport system permease protein